MSASHSHVPPPICINTVVRQKMETKILPASVVANVCALPGLDVVVAAHTCSHT